MNGDSWKKRYIVLSLAVLLVSFPACGYSYSSAEGKYEGETVKVIRDFSLEEQISCQEEKSREGSDSRENQIDPDSQEQIGASSFLMEEASTYAYDTLTLMQQVWYRQMAECFGEMAEEIRLDISVMEEGVTLDDIDLIFQCVLTDHPELFFVDGYTYTKYLKGEKMVGITFAGSYTMAREEAFKRKQEIEAVTVQLLDGAGTLADDYERIKYVYETIIYNTEYDLDAEDNQNIYSVFCCKRSVCQGYAKATQYLLNRLGVEAVLVQGVVDQGERHAWNLVKADGSYYYVDTTWGDASFQRDDEQQIGDVPNINYDYLCVDTETIQKTHTINGFLPLPYCVNERDNYYVRENAVFYDYDREQMKALFDRQLEQGRMYVSFKCSDQMCFDKVKEALIDGLDIFDYFYGSGSEVAYSLNDKFLTMTFWMTNE